MNAVITGATKGIGRSIAYKLAAAGYNLAICSRVSNELLGFITELRALHPALKIVGVPTDCSDRESLKQFTNFVLEHFNGTDVLVNNAGKYLPSTILDEDDRILDTQMALHLYAPYYLSKFFGSLMRAAGSGHIINICSVAAISPVVEAGSYSVTKYALLGLTNVLREELRPFKVKVTAIIPGATLTGSWDKEETGERNYITVDDVSSAVLSCLQTSPGCNLDEIILRPVRSFTA